MEGVMKETLRAEVSAPTVREFKAKLAALALMIIGQHFWSNKLQGISISCLCKCCCSARQAHMDATGLWPTNEQEVQAMEDWGRGGRGMTEGVHEK